MVGRVLGRVLALAVLAVALSAAGGCGGAMGGGATGPANAERVGAPAPDFSLAPADGGAPIGPTAFAGKVLIVDFWATWCAPCRQSFPVYQRLVDKFGGKLVVLAVSVDDAPDGIGKFRSDTGVKFPIVWDQGQAVAASYKPGTMPTSFVIDRSGLVHSIHEGFHQRDEATLEQEIRSLL
jgi:cytochrome c biogenesis protein CcmG/thiol:disulfide interchange protein DsbE